MKQRTLAREVSIKGSSLHTGDAVTLTLKPAPVDQGFVFRRIDLPGAPELRPRIDQVTDLVRATTIQVGHAKIQTIEHVLSALSGCGIDNVVIEMNASEPPILDGSAKPFVSRSVSCDEGRPEAGRPVGHPSWPRPPRIPSMILSSPSMNAAACSYHSATFSGWICTKSP
jgi:UDP-3-O-[3-hydroxymyristoyl] N-acetylglucosamine deacetylase/3-hydroxyacyl-[acyl-carrier-protein] dehydratase